MKRNTYILCTAPDSHAVVRPVEPRHGAQTPIRHDVDRAARRLVPCYGRPPRPALNALEAATSTGDLSLVPLSVAHHLPCGRCTAFVSPNAAKVTHHPDAGKLDGVTMAPLPPCQPLLVHPAPADTTGAERDSRDAKNKTFTGVRLSGRR